MSRWLVPHALCVVERLLQREQHIDGALDEHRRGVDAAHDVPRAAAFEQVLLTRQEDAEHCPGDDPAVDLRVDPRTRCHQSQQQQRCVGSLERLARVERVVQSCSKRYPARSHRSGCRSRRSPTESRRRTIRRPCRSTDLCRRIPSVAWSFGATSAIGRPTHVMMFLTSWPSYSGESSSSLPVESNSPRGSQVTTL